MTMRYLWLPLIALLILACGEGGGSSADGGVEYDCSAPCRFYVIEGITEGDGTSWETAFDRVNLAADMASGWTEACEDTCEVWVAAGTYNVFTTSHEDTIALGPGVELYGGFTGVESSLEERDWATNVTVLDGKSATSEAWAEHVIEARGENVVDGFRITNQPDLTYFNQDQNEGRGIHHLGGTLTTRNCVFAGNRVKLRYGYNDGDHWGSHETGSGGAIYSDGDTLTVEDCEFQDNHAVVGGAICSTSATSILRSTFADNTATGQTNSESVGETWTSRSGYGGAIYVHEQHLTVTDSSFTGNHSVQGGAIRSTSTAEIADTDFQDNSVSGSATSWVARGGGGALFLEAPTTLTGCTFNQNRALLGGAVLTEGEIHLEDCELRSNSASAGGAIFVPAMGDATTIIDSRFDGNTATEECRDHEYYEPDCNVGGALATRGKPLVARNCLFTNNIALVGGAVHGYTPADTHWFTNSVFFANMASGESSSTDDIGMSSAVHVYGAGSKFHIRNSIVSGNTADDGTLLYGNSPVTHSLVEGGWDGDGNIDEDPLFTDPDGGDFSLLPGSPCIDAADGEAAPEFDIDGNPRVDDPDSPNTGIGPPWADMGANEYQP